MIIFFAYSVDSSIPRQAVFVFQIFGCSSRRQILVQIQKLWHKKWILNLFKIGDRHLIQWRSACFSCTFYTSLVNCFLSQLQILRKYFPTKINLETKHILPPALKISRKNNLMNFEKLEKIQNVNLLLSNITIRCFQRWSKSNIGKERVKLKNSCFSSFKCSFTHDCDWLKTFVDVFPIISWRGKCLNSCT